MYIMKFISLKFYCNFWKINTNLDIPTIYSSFWKNVDYVIGWVTTFKMFRGKFYLISLFLICLACFFLWWIKLEESTPLQVHWSASQIYGFSPECRELNFCAELRVWWKCYTQGQISLLRGISKSLQRLPR